MKNGLNTEQQLLAGKKKLRTLMMRGLTGTEIAQKFGISRSCYFDALKNNPELNALRNEVREDLRQRLETTLIERALGDYTKSQKDAITTYTVTESGGKKETSKKETKFLERTTIYKGESDLGALKMALAVYSMNDARDQESSIVDDIDPTEFTYPDSEES